MLSHFGWRAALAVVASTLAYFAIFRRELIALAARPAASPKSSKPDDAMAADTPLLPVPRVGHPRPHALHGLDRGHRALSRAVPRRVSLLSRFAKATSPYQSRIELKAPLLVGFFLAGLVIHGGLQGWWIAPVLARLSDMPLFLGATLLTAVQRQRAHHLPGDARARPERAAEDRRRRRAP